MTLNGILADHQIAALVDDGVITTSRPLDDDQIQPASLDVRLGNTAYRLRASFLPGPDGRVQDRLCPPLVMHQIDLRAGAVLETGCIYLVPLMESLDLPPHCAGRANPKSSTGRIDVFTRLICDGAGAFDTVPAGHKGPLWLEVSPRTFSILVRPGDRLAQVRLFETAGEPSSAGQHHQEVSLALPQTGIAGYRAKRHSGVLDLSAAGAHNPHEFWEPLYAPKGNLILDPGEFYILASREAICIGADVAAEMAPIAPDIGEFRVHYAGFFDPGFGHAAGGAKSGARAVLEVRGRDVPFLVEDRQTIARLDFSPMAARPDALYGDNGSHYQGQGLKLSKLFSAWG